MSSGFNKVAKAANESNGTYLAANADMVPVIWFFPRSPGFDRQIRQNNPVQAIKFTRDASPADPMINEYAVSAYVTLGLPDTKVIVGGRVSDFSGVTRNCLQWTKLETDPALIFGQIPEKLPPAVGWIPIAHAIRFSLEHCMLERDNSDLLRQSRAAKQPNMEKIAESIRLETARSRERHGPRDIQHASFCRSTCI